MIMVCGLGSGQDHQDPDDHEREASELGVIVTVAQGFNLDYVWANQGGGRESGREPGAVGYYIDAAQDGEPPGQWWGKGAAELGQTGEVEREPYDAVYTQIHPLTGEQLGRRPAKYADKLAVAADLIAAEPHATGERRREIEREAASRARVSAPYTDMTVSYSKSVSVFHASLRENTRRALLAGDHGAAARWERERLALEAILQDANRAALEFVQEHAGITRTGYHGARVNGKDPGKYEAAELVVSSWLQGTSREGDPQDHIHNQIARMTLTGRDGAWRALDTMSLRTVLPAVQPVAATYVECAMTARFGVRWRARPDGKGNEIDGISRETLERFSSRTETINGPELERAVARWRERFGVNPNTRQLQAIKQRVTMMTRAGKAEGDIDYDALCASWDAREGGELASVAPRVSGLRADGVRNAEVSRGDWSPDHAAARSIVCEALARVQSRSSAWTRAELMKEIGLCMPPESRDLPPAEAAGWLERLTDAGIAGAFDQVAPLESPAWPPVPDHLRRAGDGRSVYTRPGTAKYATGVQLAAEEHLVNLAGAYTGPMLAREVAASLVAADPGVLEEALSQRAQSGRDAGNLDSGLRLDQASALYHLLTSGRVAEVLVGPAGSGKTHVMSAAARAWQEATGTNVLGLTTSQAARNVLVNAGVPQAQNTAEFLGHLPGERGKRGIRTRLAPGSLVMLDEASMTSTDDMRDVLAWAAEHGHKVIITGDPDQLAAVENGGGMMLVARRLGYVQLAEAVRFRAPWEQDASLRLRAGDTAVLSEYGEHARIRGDVPNEAMEDARRSYVAQYLAGHDVLLIAQERARCRELSRRIRDDLVHLGYVDDSREVPINHGASAGVGDFVIARDNDHGRGIANGDVFRVAEIGQDGRMTLAKITESDRDGRRKFDTTPRYSADYSNFDLGYAITGHSAQGRTVHSGIAVVSGSEDRQWLYVSMTRGRESNTAIAFTRGHRNSDARPGAPASPEIARHAANEAERAGQPVTTPAPGGTPEPRDPGAVLADVMSRDGHSESATETRRANLADEDHLGKLHAEWQGETSAYRDARYRSIVTKALEGTEHKWGYTATWLCRSLRHAELAGLDPQAVVNAAVSGQSLDGARDPVAVLDSRIRKATGAILPSGSRPWSAQVPDITDEAKAQHARNLAAAMDGRKVRIGEFITETEPVWATAALGPVPDDQEGKAAWSRRAAEIGAYREMFGYDHPGEPIGPEPAHDSPEKRAGWHHAAAAMTRSMGEDLSALSDGALYARRASYERETSWAPKHVGADLEHMRAGARDSRERAIRAEAEAGAARRADDQARAERHETIAASAAWMTTRYEMAQDDAEQTATARAGWEASTRDTRHRAVAADSELRRRGAELAPLVSAEPVRTTPQELAELDAFPADVASGPELPEWIAQEAARRRAAEAEVAERQSMPMPHEDHELEPDEAWPSWRVRERDAVLQPPKPEMEPAAEVSAQLEPEAGK